MELISTLMNNFHIFYYKYQGKQTYQRLDIQFSLSFSPFLIYLIMNFCLFINLLIFTLKEVSIETPLSMILCFIGGARLNQPSPHHCSASTIIRRQIYNILITFTFIRFFKFDHFIRKFKFL